MVSVNTNLETDWCENRTLLLTTSPIMRHHVSIQPTQPLLSETLRFHPIVLLLSDTEDDDDDINDTSRNILSPASMYCI